MNGKALLGLGIAVAVAMAGCGSDGEVAHDGGGTPDGRAPDTGTPDTGTPDGGQLGSITDPDRSASVGGFAADEGGEPEAAYDGIIDQGAADSDSETVEYGDGSPMLAREWRCMVRLERVAVHGPSDGPLFEGGETGRVLLFGYELEEADWTLLAEKPVGGESPSVPIIFDESDLPAVAFRGHGVAFVPDEPVTDGGTVESETAVRIAEVIFHGECVGEESVLEWTVGEWECHGVECVEVENDGGVPRRTVRCERDRTWPAAEALCPSPKPATEGESCTLECPYELIYVGDRSFTYSNGSGWLHEGGVGHRAGPLPTTTTHGSTVEAIEGKPCSILTTNPLTYFAGISCSPEQGIYCAFQCLDPSAE
ncbi:MAG: hypothetical protein ACOC97_04630 [Myxococcota bacterium]